MSSSPEISSGPGYQSGLYAASLKEFGSPRRLENCLGWILERNIPDTGMRDAMGAYPLFCCENWQRLPDDVRTLEGSGLVSLALVPDPFGDISPSQLEETFDVVVPFKHHFVADMKIPRDRQTGKQHRRMVRRALETVEVELCPDPLSLLETWVDLFANLRERHNITTLRAFSRSAFRKQLQVPGTRLFVARVDQEIVGMDWWYVQGDVAQGHLAAFSPKGYDALASYATKWHVMGYFADRVRWVNLGGAPGTQNSGKDGLTLFKRGWASETRQAYFFGRILDPERYAALSRKVQGDDDAYFPAYRSGEFR